MIESKVKFTRLQDLSPVLEEYTEWFARIMRCLQYPETYEDSKKSLLEPQQFLAWVAKMDGDTFLNDLTLNDMRKLYDDLHNIASNLLLKVSYPDAERITLGEFDNFIHVYDNFIIRLHQLEQACLEIDIGLDQVSGLRNEEAMYQELNIELERRARRGNPFCLILGRIDHYDHIHQNAPTEEYSHVIKEVGSIVFKCLRTFDDAYRLQNGDFILNLKHTGTTGGTAAINRLRSMLDDADLSISDGDKRLHITMSYCLSEPMPGDTVDELLKFMRADLKSYETEEQVAVEYVDKSPLSRFIEQDD